MAGWTFVTSHAHVLLCVARDAGIRHRYLAEQVGITERAAQRIVADLVEVGYLEWARTGRRNTFQLHTELPLRHPLEGDHHIGKTLTTLVPAGPDRGS